MPIDFGVAGFSIPQHERVGLLIAAVGGPTKAANLTGRTRTHIDNMRKPDAPLRIDDLLPLCKEAGVSLDWVASGYQVRPDLATRAGFGEAGGASSADLVGFARLAPVRPETAAHAGHQVERWAPAELALSGAWFASHGLSAETARYAVAGDDGMAPLVRKGGLVVVDARPSKPRSGVYIVEAGDELLVRRLSPMPGNRLELTADALPNWRLSIVEGDQDTPIHRIVWASQDV